MDQKSRSGLPMTGEDTGLEVLASPLAGYLGKVSRALVLLSLLSLAQSWIEFEKELWSGSANPNSTKENKTEIFGSKRRKCFGLKLVMMFVCEIKETETVYYTFILHIYLKEHNGSLSTAYY